jgi:hypothetical protein
VVIKNSDASPALLAVVAALGHVHLQRKPSREPQLRLGIADRACGMHVVCRSHRTYAAFKAKIVKLLGNMYRVAGLARVAEAASEHGVAALRWRRVRLQRQKTH